VSTVSSVVTKLRTRLGEASEHEFDDGDQLVPYVALAEQWLAQFLGRLRGSGYFRHRQTFSLSASTETYALSSLAKTFAELVELTMQADGGYWNPVPVLRDGDEFLVRNQSIGAPSGLVLPAARLLHESIQFLPTSTSARTFGIVFRYLPSLKTSGSESLETPAALDYVLVLRAQHFALADEGATNTSFDEEYAGTLAEIEDQYAGRQFGASTETIRRKASVGLFG